MNESNVETNTANTVEEIRLLRGQVSELTKAIHELIGMIEVKP